MHSNETYSSATKATQNCRAALGRYPCPCRNALLSTDQLAWHQLWFKCWRPATHIGMLAQHLQDRFHALVHGARAVLALRLRCAVCWACAAKRLRENPFCFGSQTELCEPKNHGPHRPEMDALNTITAIASPWIYANKSLFQLSKVKGSIGCEEEEGTDLT